MTLAAGTRLGPYEILSPPVAGSAGEVSKEKTRVRSGPSPWMFCRRVCRATPTRAV